VDHDETGSTSLTRIVDLNEADEFVLGWKELVMLELDRMRRELRYADQLVLRLECRREQL
jgi:hypothetical protein